MPHSVPTLRSSPAGTEPDRGLTDEVVRWSSELDLDAMPDEVIEVARHCLLDWLTVTVAGAREPLTQLLADEVDAGDHGPASLIARGRRCGVVGAALVNGAASHALDYDDVHLSMPGHPSAPVFPALLAVAEDVRLDGRSFLRAAVCGLEAQLRLGAAMPEHYERGWHATATLGTLGAAIACSEALGLNVSQRRHAIGLAVSQAAGVKSMFGSMTKPVQVGRAAANGAFAARLAARGMTSHTSALEDEQGFLPVYGGSDGAASPWHRDRFELPDTLFKYHAACYFTHAGIDAASRLLARGIDASDIVEVRVGTNPVNLSVCDIRRPRTGLEAKFSMTTTTAMGLLGIDTASPATFEDDAVTDRRLRDLAARTSVVAVDDLERTQMTVTLRLADGSEVRADGDSSRPETELDRQRARLEDKCDRLVGPVLGGSVAREVIHAARDVEGLSDIGSLVTLVAGQA